MSYGGTAPELRLAADSYMARIMLHCNMKIDAAHKIVILPQIDARRASHAAPIRRHPKVPGP